MIEQLMELRAIYRSLPTIACQGRCWNSCGPIDMSDVEREQIRSRGYEIPEFTEERSQRWANDEPLHCPALNRTTLRCDVYEDRPLICRVWGVADSMQCEHGCKATGMLSDAEVYEVIFRSYRIGGHPGADEEAGERMRQMLEDPELGPLMARFIRGDRSVEADLKRAIAERMI